FSRDWSSDVCSSDLDVVKGLRAGLPRDQPGSGILARRLIEVTVDCQEFTHRSKVLGVLSPPAAARGQPYVRSKCTSKFPRRPLRSEERRVGKAGRSR